MDGLIDAILGLQRMRDAEQAAVLDHPPTFPDEGVSLAEGERLVAEAISRFMAARDAWEAVPEAQRPAPPRMAVIATLGVGKTKVVADAIGALAAGTAVNVLSPDHALGRELTARLAAAAPGHAVVQILGREAIDADGVPMCQHREQVAAWAALGGSVQSAFCRREKDDGTVEACEHFTTCRYQAQRADDSPAIRVGSHAHLALPQEVNSVRLDALTVVDESPVDTLVRVGPTVKLDDVWRAQGRQVVTRRPSTHADDNADFDGWSSDLRQVLEQSNPTPAMLREAGFEAGRCKRMAGWWFDLARMGEEVTPTMSAVRKEEIIKGRMQTSKVALRMARLWKLLEELLALPAKDDLDELRCIRVRKGTVELAYSVEAKVEGPLLLLDGTADDEILRRFWPDIEIVRVRVKPEHYHLIQVTDRAVSMAMLADGDTSEAARAAGHRAEVARLAEVEATRVGAAEGTKVAMFSFKSAAAAIRRDHGHLPDLGVECGFLRPDGKSAGHFGAVRGLDRWCDVPTAIVAGRIRPSPADLERHARAVFWKDPRPMEYLPVRENLPTVTEYLRMAGGGSVAVDAESHPDPIIRRVLDQICRADLEQTVHRLRLVRRTADNPARVLLLTNVALPLAVHEAVTWAEVVERCDPAAMVLARGVFPNDWPGRAKVLADFFGDAADPPDAARQWFRKRAGSRQRVENTMRGEQWTAYLCRPVGARARETVWVDRRHADPRAAVEAFLGPLDVFTPAAQA